MSVLNLPRLASTLVRQLVTERKARSVAELADLAAPTHKQRTFAPVGTRISDDALSALRDALVSSAAAYGYPGAASDSSLLKWEQDATILCWEHLSQVASAEAARNDTWAFLTTVLLPDLTAWRFGVERRAEGLLSILPRFEGGRRNMLRRWWWRARGLAEGNLLRSEVLAALREDDLVQLFERPLMAGVPGLPARLVSEHLRLSKEGKPTSVRDLCKRVYRRMPYVALDALEHEALAVLARTLAEETSVAAGGGNVGR